MALKEYATPVHILYQEPRYMNEAWLNGLADEETGEVNEYGWHLYRIDQYIVATSAHGDKILYAYACTSDAQNAFEGARELYLNWREMVEKL